jgi:AcrR family transcriptional regulator
MNDGSDLAEPELPRAIALAWGIAEQPMRGPKREMSIERIVEAAVELADAEGIGAVSMSSVAGRLGYTTMSLYRYVSAKDDLLVLMTEEGVGLPPDSDPIDADWRRGLRRWAAALNAAYLRHPWLLDIAIEGVPLAPNNLAWLDWGLRILASSPLTRDEGTSTVLMLSGLTRWQAGLIRVLTQSDRPPDYDERVLRALVNVDRLPEVHAAVIEGVFGPGVEDTDPFAFALERALDGLDAYMATIETQGRIMTSAPDDETDETDDQDYPRDAQLKETTRDRREAERRLRELRRREAELIARARRRRSG